MTTYFDDLKQCGFAVGATPYLDYYPGQEDNRIVLTVEIKGEIQQNVPVILDTGSPWCVFDPQTVKLSGINIETGEPFQRFIVRGSLFDGWLVRIPITILAEEGSGEELPIEATAFVPDCEDWPHPNFLGLSGFLNHVRFALDPYENAFYFGVS